MKSGLLLISIFLLISCQSKQTESKSSNEDIKTDDPSSVNVSVKELVNIPDHPDYDTLHQYLISRDSISPKFYNRLFDYEMIKFEKAFINKIWTYKDLVIVLSRFHTIHSDSPEEIQELFIFDNQLNLKSSNAIEFEIGYDLYNCGYRLINDSTLKLIENQYTNYDQDTLKITTHTVRFNDIGSLDTLETDSTFKYLD